MHELLVDGAHELDRDHVEPIGKEVELTRLQVFSPQEPRHPIKMPRVGNRCCGWREHVAVEGVSQPSEQPCGSGTVLQNLAQIAMTALRDQLLFGDYWSVNQVLNEDAASDQSLGVIVTETCIDQDAFQSAQVSQQPVVDARLATDARHPAPESPRLHCQASSDRIESRQFRVD